jgi:hypothetical protein
MQRHICIAHMLAANDLKVVSPYKRFFGDFYFMQASPIWSCAARCGALRACLVIIFWLRLDARRESQHRPENQHG